MICQNCKKEIEDDAKEQTINAFKTLSAGMTSIMGVEIICPHCQKQAGFGNFNGEFTY